jgi:hypothetical protein
MEHFNSRSSRPYLAIQLSSTQLGHKLTTFRASRVDLVGPRCSYSQGLDLMRTPAVLLRIVHGRLQLEQQTKRIWITRTVMMVPMKSRWAIHPSLHTHQLALRRQRGNICGDGWNIVGERGFEHKNGHQSGATTTKFRPRYMDLRELLQVCQILDYTRRGIQEKL